jgi:hypothetical protein
MQEASWNDFDDEEEVVCDTCNGKTSCHCDDDYERWKEQQMEIYDDDKPY